MAVTWWWTPAKPTKHAARLLVEGSRAAAGCRRDAGVRHHVCVSIVGCGLAPMGYYKVKVRQEQVTEQSPLPWTIVRATQFHELALSTLVAAARWRVLPVPRARLQTIACAEVARAVADVAEGAPRHRRVEVAGPENAEARDLARTWRSVTGRRVALVPVAVPGKLGRALRDGALAAGRPDVSGTTGFAAWLEAVDAGRVVAIDAVRNPDKLTTVPQP